VPRGRGGGGGNPNLDANIFALYSQFMVTFHNHINKINAE